MPHTVEVEVVRRNLRWEVRVHGVARPLIDWSCTKERAIEHARERAHEVDVKAIVVEGPDWSVEEVIHVLSDLRAATRRSSPEVHARSAVKVVKSEPRSSGILWTAAGAVVVLFCLLGVLYVHEDENPAAQLAWRARRVDLVAQMESDLAAASEAEKSAVLATSDQESQTLADQARAASAKVEKERRELDELLAMGGIRSEQDLSAQVRAAFAELQRLDEEVLALAVKNTNVKAYALAFGPAATAVEEMNAALDRLRAASADSPAAKPMTLFVYAAETGALRIQTLLPPHIAEEDDAKMDALEASMATEDAKVRQGLNGLAALPKLGKDPELATATARYAELVRLKTQILALSRENTNVRSLSLSLNGKRKAMLLCQDALGALHRAILAEPIAAAGYGPPARPR